jgi:phosphonate transport system substrate-binding protein
MSDQPTLRFSLPPALGASRAGSLADELQRYLVKRTDHDVTVVVANDYAGIEDDLVFGKSQAAWAPPMLCQRVSDAGGRFILHAVRRGVSSYRSGLVRRKDSEVTVDTFGEARAAWVSEESFGGYLLAKEWLKGRGIDADTAFKSSEFLGSYEACVQALIDGAADVTAVFVSSEAAAKPYDALHELALPGTEQLEIFAFSGEHENDGIVISPECEEVTVDALTKALTDMDDEGRQVLKDIFNAEALEAPAA